MLTCSIYLRDRAKQGLKKYPAIQECAAQTETLCLSAASQMADIISIVGHVDLRSVDTLISFILYEAARVLLREIEQRKNAQIRSSLQFVLDALGGLSPPNSTKSVFLQALADEFPRLDEMVHDPRRELSETNRVSEIDYSAFESPANNESTAVGQVNTTATGVHSGSPVKEVYCDSYDFQDFGDNLDHGDCPTWVQESCEGSLGHDLFTGVPPGGLVASVSRRRHSRQN